MQCGAACLQMVCENYCRKVNADVIKIKSEYIKRSYPIDYPARLFHGRCATRLSCYVTGHKGEIYKSKEAGPHD